MTPQKEIEDRVWILERLKSEYRKHGKTEGLDWMAIAANKIAKSLPPNQAFTCEDYQLSGKHKCSIQCEMCKSQVDQVGVTAEEIAVKFAIYIRENKWQGFLLNSWIQLDGNGNQINVVESIQELFDIFKQTLPPPTILTTISELGEGEIPEYVADYINDTKIEGNERAEIMVKRNLLLFYEYIKEDIEPLRKELLYAKTEAAQLGNSLPDDEKITELAFDNGYGMDINTPKLESAEHIACCAGIRIGANFMFNQFKS